ncbi:hypothetical protein [Geomonas subterranea]|uniref:Ig-like domain-containing protein n=1 Tax=Geomonas subterranea TaxID=2847989 RepID=A0ABX8LDQ2_9BACT|nr:MULTISPECIES: hypothetical protein [Geomonas]QXE89792.1 hypothetical protein KP001_15340 [Geomonas subterranea]
MQAAAAVTSRPPADSDSDSVLYCSSTSRSALKSTGLVITWVTPPARKRSWASPMT